MTETVKTKPVKNPSPKEVRTLLNKLNKKYACTVSVDITYWVYAYPDQHKLVYVLYISDPDTEKNISRFDSWEELKEAAVSLLKA